MAIPSDAITHAIQLAVTPVFLLAGVGAVLNVLAHRLGRIIDRARVLRGRLYDEPGLRDGEDTASELRVLDARMRVVNLAITLCTLCALLICTVVAVIFASDFVDVSLGPIIAGCFVAAMTCLIVALLALLIEIYLATTRLSIRR